MRTKRLSAVLCLIAMLAVMVFGAISVSAAYTSPMNQLKSTLVKGEYTGKSGTIKNKKLDYTTRQYKVDGGGTITYSKLFNPSSVKDGSTDSFFSPAFETLKKGSKQDLLEDIFTMCNYMAYDTANGGSTGTNAVSDDTVNEFYQQIQNEAGMGSQMLAALLQNTKPDFVSANRLYQPFSGVVGTILGVIAVLIMALLGITMALDIAFIVIPAFQLMMGADGSGENGKDNANRMSRLISSEARQAVQANGDSNGSGGQSGSDKQALGIYFKKRWKSLVLLGICLLYLVSGQIYSLVAWIIDLLSGALG